MRRRASRGWIWPSGHPKRTRYCSQHYFSNILASLVTLVPSLQIAYVWHASLYTREVLDGLLRIGFLHHQQIIWDKQRTVLTRTLYWFQHEPCWFVRKKNAPWYGKAGENSTIWACPSPKFIFAGSDEEKFDHPTQKPVELMRRPLLNHTKRGSPSTTRSSAAAPRSPRRKSRSAFAGASSWTPSTWTSLSCATKV